MAIEESTFSGLLSDVFDSKTPVTISTIAGRTHSGVITKLGNDFVGVNVNSSHSPVTLLRFDSITSVRTQSAPRSSGVASMRALGTSLQSMSMEIVDMASEAMRAKIILIGSNDMISGEMYATGKDYLIVGLGSPITQSLYIPFDQIIELSV